MGWYEEVTGQQGSVGGGYSTSHDYGPGTYFTGTSTANRYVVGSVYQLGGGSFVARADGSFQNVTTGQVLVGSSEAVVRWGAPGGSLSGPAVEGFAGPGFPLSQSGGGVAQVTTGAGVPVVVKGVTGTRLSADGSTMLPTSRGQSRFLGAGSQLRFGDMSQPPGAPGEYASGEDWNLPPTIFFRGKPWPHNPGNSPASVWEEHYGDDGAGQAGGWLVFLDDTFPTEVDAILRATDDVAAAGRAIDEGFAIAKSWNEELQREGIFDKDFWPSVPEPQPTKRYGVSSPW